jgi:GT2 family glycosyltransferase
MPFRRHAVPEALLTPLLQGGVGKVQLHNLARTALDLLAEGPDNPLFPLADFVREAFLCAWEEAPLDLNCVFPLLELHESWPCLPSSLLRLLREIRQGQHVPDNTELRRLAQDRDERGLFDLIEKRCRLEPGNGYWLQQAILLGYSLDLARLEKILARADMPAPVLDLLRADAALLKGEYASAVRRYAAVLRMLPLPGWRVRLGESLFRAGQTDEALHHWEAAFAARPWMAQLLLRCDDVRKGRHLPGGPPAGKGVILLYTWNKAEALNGALASLHASQSGGADVVVLDNGSNDGTPALLADWALRFGPRFSRIRLPCNIGAPAARNWLLCLPQMHDYDWIVFLDDDIILPPDWLGFFGTAVRAYPERNVFGCRVVDHDRPHMIQCADFHLLPGDAPNKKPGGLPDYVQRFAVSTLHIQAAQDFGQFSYLRPCASVTGCCHLFRREALFATGFFDLRYSPSQFDDFEHDLRHVMRGDMPVYQGWLRIPHFRRTGGGNAPDDPQRAGSWANMYKLQMRYTREQFDAIRAAEREALLADVLERAP